MSPSFKDRLADLSAHYWIHLAAALCIGVLFYQNKQQEYLIEQQASESRVLFQLTESSYFVSVQKILTDAMQKLHPEHLSSGIHHAAASQRPGFMTEGRVTFTFALSEEKSRELPGLEPQLRATLAEEFARMHDLEPEWQLLVYEGREQADAGSSDFWEYELPPDKKCYTIDVQFAFRKLAGEQE